LKQFVLYIKREPNADLLDGQQHWCCAVWPLAMSMTEIFAAFVTICGGGMCRNAAPSTGSVIPLSQAADYFWI